MLYYKQLGLTRFIADIRISCYRMHVNDICTSHRLEKIYSYLIDTPGEYTKETLKANKGLEVFNYYIYQVGIRSKLTM